MEASPIPDAVMAEKAREFDRVAQEVFAPIYPVIASRLLELSGIRRGCCLDIGCGSGHLGLAVARAFQGTVILLDINPYALALAKQRIPEDARGCIQTLWGDVHALPLRDASVDLAVSRGAIYQSMSVRNGEDFGASQEKSMYGAAPFDYARVMEGLGLGVPRCIHEESGDWLLFRKPLEGGERP
ncbi:MAG: methyltransferase domain-containing protein [Treponema sp.]|jgi:hypothetical protein|nr:methyltransferase domain-containing protein [Treponema sp.]